MMQIKMLNIDQVNENLNMYFKMASKSQPDWDQFDEVLLQLSMMAMKDPMIKLQDKIDRLDDAIE